MNNWYTQLAKHSAIPCVLVTVAVVKGSAPREAGTKMLITQKTLHGTIGGGHLELKAIEIARELLATPLLKTSIILRRFPLGPSLGQCCGGLVILALETIPANQPVWIAALERWQQTQQVLVLASPVDDSENKLIVSATATWGDLGEHQAQVISQARTLLHNGGTLLWQADNKTWLFEPIRPDDLHIVLFGAGHVGKALVTVLSGLPCRITWIDNREEQFPDRLQDNVTPLLSDDPVYEVNQAPANSYFLIMTHSHPLDLALCEQVLQRGDFRYCGLIGSQSKRNRFDKRLKLKDLSQEDLQRLRCPIGIDGISGKHPTTIAIAVAAEILRDYEHITQSTQAEP